MRSILGRDVDPPWILGAAIRPRRRVAARQLERVLLAPADEQRLFEIGVRLTYADEPALLLSALTELREGLLADLPAQALLQRPTALEATIALARAVNGPSATYARPGSRPAASVSPGAVRAAALETLRAAARGVQRDGGVRHGRVAVGSPPPPRTTTPLRVRSASRRGGDELSPRSPGGIAAAVNPRAAGRLPCHRGRRNTPSDEAFATLPVAARRVARSASRSPATARRRRRAPRPRVDHGVASRAHPRGRDRAAQADARPDAVAARLGVSERMENARASAHAGVAPTARRPRPPRSRSRESGLPAPPPRR